jgi:hypothetical protein
VLVLLALLSSLMTSCADRPPVYYTGVDYLRLTKGQTYQATREQETWASEAVIQDKERQIIALQGAVRKLQAELDLRGKP